MASKALRLAAALVLAASQTATGEYALARGGGGGGGGGGGVSSGGHSGHVGHFSRPFLRHHFLRNQAVLGGWGWGWGWPYNDMGYNSTTVVFPQALPQAVNVTGSTATTPCHWNEDTFTVPASAGGTRPIQVVSCR